MEFAILANQIFDRSVIEYHKTNDIDFPIQNPYVPQSIEYYLYLKNWIDNVQWDLEDIIRDPNIEPAEALIVKRRIDKSNQDRTDLVELIDSYFLEQYKNVKKNADAKLNTETPAWTIDRLSILHLKIYHMHKQLFRFDATEEHKAQCQVKLNVLLEQKQDLTIALEQLFEDFSSGKKIMKVYKQMKMYNDPNMIPILLGGKNK